MISLEVNPETPLDFLQQKFSKAFPYLKIEFFKKPHQEKEGSEKDDMLTALHTKVGSISSLSTDLILVIHPNMRVGEMEKLFADHLYLFVQVFSKSGKIWLESVHSDELSLQELNDRAKERNTAITEKIDPADYHEQE